MADRGILAKMKNDKRYRIIIIGLAIHFLLLFAVFDLYFSSPLDNGMIPIKTSDKPLAKRVILIVADGLRAEAIWGQEKESRTPFLTSIRKTRGSWGTVHTRVPTESRPGHVAMLAGIYEDPSAILKGWKSNPVDFDSVINQSTNAWCWGSPDIVNIFNKDNLPHIRLHTYGAEMEDFGQHDTTLLDTWVFDKVETFLNEEIKNCEICDDYFNHGNLFFLHLLGIDTAGHGFKPHSKEYINNIILVDEKVRELERLVENTFQDNATAYIFTSDHGMTDWGSHGAGSDHETKTPIILWGSGIRKNSRRQDVYQINIAPLMSSILGINIPINSLGKVPYNYLDTSKDGVANLMIANTLQLIEIFNVKRLRTMKHAIVFIPFQNIDSDVIRNKIKYFENLYDEGKYEKVIEQCEEYMDILIQGLEYYHNYYQKAILLAITIGFLAWIIYLGIFVIYDKRITLYPPIPSTKIYYLFFGVVLTILLCYRHRFPKTYYLYFLFPVVMSYLITDELENVTHFFESLKYIKVKTVFFSFIFYFCGVELLVSGFYYRISFTVLSVLVASWIFFSETLKQKMDFKEKAAWFVSWMLLSIFPFLPVMKTSFSVPLYGFGFLAWLFLFYSVVDFRLKIYYRLENVFQSNTILIVQFICLCLSAFYMLLIEYEIIHNESHLKYVSWFIALIPISFIPFAKKILAIRLSSIVFGFQPFYLLVSPNIEGLFSALFVVLLTIWLIVECKTYKSGTNIIYYSKFQTSYNSHKTFDLNSVRRGFLFMVFIFIGFFGTGNIASLNTFDPMWVRAFLTVFSPFKMMFLILIKFMVPFLYTCCVFRAINTVGRENILSMFCVILVFADLMVLQLLYLITNQGSWLEIGMSLSHFIIMEGFVTILLLLYGIAHVLTTVKYPSKIMKNQYLL